MSHTYSQEGIGREPMSREHSTCKGLDVREYGAGKGARDWGLKNPAREKKTVARSQKSLKCLSLRKIVLATGRDQIEMEIF